MKFINIILTILLLSNVNFAQNNTCIIKSEFIYKANDISFPSCHASTIEETDHGLMVAWFGGTAEKKPDVGIRKSAYSNGKCLLPVEVANRIQHKDLRYPTWYPVLFNYGDEIKLFYKVGPDCSYWWDGVIYSKDNGKTWYNQHCLPEAIWVPIKKKPIKLINGDLLCPSSTEIDGWRIHMEILPKDEKVWQKTAHLNNKKQGAIQPTILVHKNDKLQILNRSTTEKILTSWSTDHDKTWTKFEETQLPNNNSGIDVVSLEDGSHLLVYNHIKPKEKCGHPNMLNLAIYDNGVNWEAVAVLENYNNIDAEYSYPTII